MLANGNNKLMSNGERYVKNNDSKKDNVEDAMKAPVVLQMILY